MITELDLVWNCYCNYYRYNATFQTHFSFIKYTNCLQVQTYAAAHLSIEHGYLGYVLRGCGSDPFKTRITITLPDNNDQREKASQVMVYFFVSGSIFQIILILLASALYLHNCKKRHTQVRNNITTTQTSFHSYGIFWGCVTASVLGSVALTAHTIIIVYLLLTSGVHSHTASGWMVVTQLVLAISASLLVAIYYGKQLDIAVPTIFLLPFVIFCCNHAKETSKKIVRCLSLWSLILFVIHVFCRSGFIFLALLARPSTVITTVLLCIFFAFCLVHLLAILFIFARTKGVMQHKNIPSLVISLVQGLAFTAIFAAAICYGATIGFAGTLATYGTIMNNPYSMLSTLATPLALAAFGWALRKVSFQWLKTVTNPEATEEAEKIPLMQKLKGNVNGNAEYEHIYFKGISKDPLQWIA